MVLRDAPGLVVDSLNYGLLVDPWAARVADRSAGRFPDGADTDSNCGDFLLQPATIVPVHAAAGQTIMIDTGANLETAVIATVGRAGATTVSAATNVGATLIPVASGAGFTAGQTIAIDSGGNREMAVVASANGGGRITVSAPLTLAHAAGVQVSCTGATLTAALTKAHANGTPVASGVSTPGAPHKYRKC